MPETSEDAREDPMLRLWRTAAATMAAYAGMAVDGDMERGEALGKICNTFARASRAKCESSDR